MSIQTIIAGAGIVAGIFLVIAITVLTLQDPLGGAIFWLMAIVIFCNFARQGKHQETSYTEEYLSEDEQDEDYE